MGKPSAVWFRDCIRLKLSLRDTMHGTKDKL